MQRPVEQHVDFVPSVGLVVDLLVNEVVHANHVAKSQSEQDWRLKSTACSRLLLEKRTVALEACWFISCFLGAQFAL